MATRKLLGIGTDGKVRNPQATDGVFTRFVTRVNGTGGASHYQPNIASGSIAAPTDQNQIYCDTEASSASDDLDNITGGTEGQIIVLFAATGSRTVVCRDGVGNLRLAGNFSLDSDMDAIFLIKRGSNWLELSRMNGGT